MGFCLKSLNCLYVDDDNGNISSINYCGDVSNSINNCTLLKNFK
jgi:hypothetical protein